MSADTAVSQLMGARWGLQLQLMSARRGLQHLHHALLFEKEIIGAHDRRVNEVKSQRVGAVVFHDVFGGGVVLEPLRHLAAVLS